MAKKVEKHKMQNGAMIIFGNKCLEPKRLIILLPIPKRIMQKKNAETPISWKSKSAICEPNSPIQLWILSSVEMELKDGSSEWKLKSASVVMNENITRPSPERRRSNIKIM